MIFWLLPKESSVMWSTQRRAWLKAASNFVAKATMSEKELLAFHCKQLWLTQALERCLQALPEQSKQEIFNSLATSNPANTTSTVSSVMPHLMMYGSCVNGTAFCSGDADFAIGFPIEASTPEWGMCPYSEIDRAHHKVLLNALYHSMAEDLNNISQQFTQPGSFASFMATKKKDSASDAENNAAKSSDGKTTEQTTSPHSTLEQVNVQRIFEARIPILQVTMAPPPEVIERRHVIIAGRVVSSPNTAADSPNTHQDDSTKASHEEPNITDSFSKPTGWLLAEDVTSVSQDFQLSKLLLAHQSALSDKKEVISALMPHHKLLQPTSTQTTRGSVRKSKDEDFSWRSHRYEPLHADQPVTSEQYNPGRYGTGPSSSSAVDSKQSLQRKVSRDCRFDVCASLTGCRNSMLIRMYCEKYPVLRVLAILLKHWARQRALILNARGGWLSPYALTVLLIHYLEARGRIENIDTAAASQSIATLAKSPFSSFDEARHYLQTSEMKTSPLSLPGFCEQDPDTLGGSGTDEDSIPALFQGFFKFYATEFDWDDNIVDIRPPQHRFRTKMEWQQAITVEAEAQEKEGASTDDTKPKESVDSIKPSSGKERTLAERVLFHRLGYDVLTIRDPFEYHSLGRSVEFFRGEAIREEFRKTSTAKFEVESFLKIP